MKTTAAQVGSAKASIEVNEATVQQFVDLQSFQKIVAPFAGVMTARDVDPGCWSRPTTPARRATVPHDADRPAPRVRQRPPGVCVDGRTRPGS